MEQGHTAYWKGLCADKGALAADPHYLGLLPRKHSCLGHVLCVEGWTLHGTSAAAPVKLHALLPSWHARGSAAAVQFLKSDYRAQSSAN
mmetsp:Transcript_57856/g.79449  ORF Transcript_57856/g.79449 Transcript_57856/m.79449 type:complete len:89 (+) Transcript_57856:102-368(+)